MQVRSGCLVLVHGVGTQIMATSTWARTCGSVVARSRPASTWRASESSLGPLDHCRYEAVQIFGGDFDLLQPLRACRAAASAKIADNSPQGLLQRRLGCEANGLAQLRDVGDTPARLLKPFSVDLLMR